MYACMNKLQGQVESIHGNKLIMYSERCINNTDSFPFIMNGTQQATLYRIRVCIEQVSEVYDGLVKLFQLEI